MLNNLSTYQGSSRKNRLNKALSSTFFLSDERSTGDFLRFIYQQAQLLSYYDLDGEKKLPGNLFLKAMMPFFSQKLQV